MTPWFVLDTYTNCILIYEILLKVSRTGCATSFTYIGWCEKGWPVVACPFRAMVVLYRMLPIFIWYEMFNISTTVSTIVNITGMFSPTDFLFEKRIRLVFMDLLYIIFTYYTQGFRLNNWFSLGHLGSWINHLPLVWWSNYRFMFLNESWCVSLT